MAGEGRSLRELEVALEAAERELAALEFAVSHDLRAPLRAVEGFSALLLRDYADGIPPEAVEYLAFVREGAEQLARMVDALLLLSRLGRRTPARAGVDVAAVARRAVADVLAENPDRAVDATVAELPAARADEELVEQLFTCLVANAVKFTRDADPARVEVDSEPGDDGVPVYLVRDNGAGFAMRYADRLFQPFARLHAASDYEGVGVGLAVVRRIVGLHGGRIWAEAAEGEGATFRFTLG